MTDETMIETLGRDWTAAEVAGDIAVLDRLLAADFTAVGPVGFVLDKAQWLARFAQGLSVTSLVLDDLSLRFRGDVAVGIGVLTQTGRHRDHPIDARFRVTQIYNRADGQADGDWRLLGLHLSPIKPPAAS